MDSKLGQAGSVQPDIVRWIEHHATRIVSLAGFAGGAIAMVTGEFPAVGIALEPGTAALVAGASAALHVANRALDSFARAAGVAPKGPGGGSGS